MKKLILITASLLFLQVTVAQNVTTEEKVQYFFNDYKKVSEDTFLVVDKIPISRINENYSYDNGFYHIRLTIIKDSIYLKNISFESNNTFPTIPLNNKDSIFIDTYLKDIREYFYLVQNRDDFLVINLNKIVDGLNNTNNDLKQAGGFLLSAQSITIIGSVIGVGLFSSGNASAGIIITTTSLVTNFILSSVSFSKIRKAGDKKYKKFK